MHVWKQAAVFALLAALPVGAAHATVSYALAGTIVSDGTPQSFTYFAPGVVTTRTDLLPSDLAFVVNADEVVFQPDAPANAQVAEASDAILVQLGGSAYGYYFPIGSFAAAGTYDVLSDQYVTGVLTVTNPAPSPVQEPATALMLGVGLLSLVPVLTWRRTLGPTERA